MILRYKALPVAEFVQLICNLGTSGAIANLRLEDVHVCAGGADIPVTVSNEHDAPTCYLCCPSVAYAGYAREELRNFRQSPGLRFAMAGLLTIAAPLLSTTGLDHQVQPNNWLLATNVWCGLDAAGIETVTAALLAKWPGRAILWRSLNELSDREALNAFRSAGYVQLPARQIYLFDARGTSPKMHRDERRDLALLDSSGLEVVDPRGIKHGDFQRIEALYRKLYLEKYTFLNPQYSARFLQGMHELDLLRIFGLRNRSGCLDGVIGFFDAGDVMTAPVVGYETGVGQREGLYRQLMAIALRRARKKRVLFNMSAGAASFKRNRGGVAAIEYSAVYNRHLSFRKRLAGLAARKILEIAGIPLMRKYQL